MTGKDIETFYNTYKHNLYEVKSIEKTILTESYNYEKWSGGLVEKSMMIRNLYEENEEMLNHTIRYLKHHTEELNNELATALLQHIMYFVYENHKDYEVTIGVLTFLMPYLQEKGEKWQLLKAYYIQGIISGKWESNKPYPALLMNALFSVYDDWTKADRPGTKERILDAYYDKLVCLAKSDEINIALCLDTIAEGKQQWSRPETYELIQEIYGSENNTAVYIENKRRLFDYLATFLVEPNYITTMTEGQREVVWSYIKTEMDREIEEGRVNCRLYLKYFEYQYLTGKINQKDYVGILQKFEKPDTYFYPTDINFVMQYGVFQTILEHNRYFTDSFTYALLLNVQIFELTTNLRVKQMARKNIEQYIQGLYPRENSYIMDSYLIRAMTIVEKNAEDGQAFRFLETLFMHRQMTTAIHSVMVSKISVLMVRHFMLHRPDIFIGVLGTKTVAEVLLWKEEIEDYMRKAALCHDIGKLECSDVINMQSRRITEAEFKEIKYHAQKGAEIAAQIDAFRPYINIIKYHHLFCDGQGGYPGEESNQGISDKVLVDLLSICDSIDAATDILGRNYAEGKAFRQIITELKEQKGTRYSETLVNLLCKDTILLREISELTGARRTFIYHEIYLRSIKPIVKYGKGDERYLTEYHDRDVKAVTKFLQESGVLEKNKKFQGWKYDAKFLMKNAKKEVVGMLLGVKAPESAGKGICLKGIYIKESMQRMGIGGKLLSLAEESLRRNGYTYLCTEHMMEFSIEERFLWINGFSQDETGRLKKEIG